MDPCSEVRVSIALPLLLSFLEDVLPTALQAFGHLC